MRWRLGCLVAIVLIGAALADTLELREGHRLKGTLREVTFLANGIKLNYPRDDIVGISLGQKADKLELQDQVTVEGCLVSLTFQTTLGIRTILRRQLKTFTLDDKTTLEARQTAEAERQLRPESARPELTDEQRQALRLNYKLYKTYLAKAEEQKDKDLEAIKTKYNSRVTRVIGSIKSLERQIEAKLRRRREAQRRGYTYRDSYGRSESEYERLLRTDGLERDQRELRKAWQKAIDLKKIIRAQQRKVIQKKEATQKRLLAVGLRHKKAILEGNIPSQEEMTAAYEAALTGKPAGNKTN